MENSKIVKAYPVEIYRKRNFLGVPQWRWRVKASNGKIIAASSEGFLRKNTAVVNAEITMVSLRVHFNSDRYPQPEKILEKQCINAYLGTPCMLDTICERCRPSE